ncbi:unnamed protein product [Pedinophyceae sp. YPF-701]|nr:unnamed protein product [Pedinophyceae sp. YPF-701]
MVKQRMSTADVAAEVACLREKVVGMRLANVYDLGPKTFLLKLARSAGGDINKETEKTVVLLESGTRFHSTKYARETPGHPGPFALKLRKHVRGRRLEDIRQLGVDRIVVFTFGQGDMTHHVILELYSSGNVVLCNAQYQVLALLRSHRDDAQGLVIMPNRPYPIHACRLREPFDPERVRAALVPPPVKPEAAEDAAEADAGDDGKKARRKKKRRDPAHFAARQAVAAALPWGPQLAEHVCLLAGLQPARRLDEAPLSGGEFQALVEAIRWAESWLDARFAATPQRPFDDGADPADVEDDAAADDDASSAASDHPDGCPGGRPKTGSRGGGAAPPGWISSRKAGAWEDVDPIRFLQHEAQGREFEEFETFDDALDEYFSKVEEVREEQRRAQAEAAVLSRLEKIKADQAARARALEAEAAMAEKRAVLVEANLEKVDAAINAVNEALAAGMDWRDLERMVEDERKAGNPVAALISKLDLDRNRITLLLPDWDEVDEEGVAPAGPPVDVDLSVGAFANVALQHGNRKLREEKAAKTMQANERALEVAEKKAREQLSQVREKATIKTARKPFWFEKFSWFITSENFLVLSGRDAQQNELLVKRYMGPGDVYVHAELHGASSTIVKNPDPSQPIPPLTLAQAGCQCVCRSAAWDSKVVTSAWWVYPHQVSKTAPTGEYLTTGSFIIRGKKNFLPPFPLVLGFGFLFRLDDSSVAAHLGERAPKTLDALRGEDAAAMGASLAPAGKVARADPATRTTATDGAPQGADADAGGASDAEDVDQMIAGAADDLSALDALLEESPGGGERRGESRAARPADPLAAAMLDGRYGLDEIGEEELPPEVEEAMRAREGAGGSGAAGAQGPGAAAGAGGGGDSELKAALDAERARRKKKEDAKQKESNKRSQKGKSKKSAKWADQDEEERNLAMALLRSQGEKKDRKQRKEERKQRMTERALAKERAEGRALPETKPEMVLEAARAAGLRDGTEARRHGARAAGTGDGDATAQAEEGGSRAGASEAREAAAMREVLENEGEEVLHDAERERLTQLDLLTGVPREADVLLHAIPVCAPYSALQGYKYRLKVTPGTQKKGKAGRQAVEFLTKGVDGVTARERELIKAVTDAELVATMVGNAKLSMPGMAKLQTAAKRAKKKAAGKGRGPDPADA